MNQLNNPDFQFNTANGHPDISSSLQLINATTADASKKQVQKLTGSLSKLSSLISM